MWPWTNCQSLRSPTFLHKGRQNNRTSLYVVARIKWYIQFLAPLPPYTLLILSVGWWKNWAFSHFNMRTFYYRNSEEMLKDIWKRSFEETPADVHSATLWAHLLTALRDTFLLRLWTDRCSSSKDPKPYPPNWQSRGQIGFLGGETTWELEDLWRLSWGRGGSIKRTAGVISKEGKKKGRNLFVHQFASQTTLFTHYAPLILSLQRISYSTTWNTLPTSQPGGPSPSLSTNTFSSVRGSSEYPVESSSLPQHSVWPNGNLIWSLVFSCPPTRGWPPWTQGLPLLQPHCTPILAHWIMQG